MLGHTNGGPSAKFAFSEGSHGTRAVDSKMIPRAKLDLSGTAPYWASAIPADMPQKQQELKGEDRLNDIPPELRKSFRQRMEDLVSGKAAQRKHDAGPLRQLADGIKAITSDSSHHSPLPASRSAQGSWKGGTEGGASAVSSKDRSEKQVLAAAAHDPLNANDRINRYMDSQVLSKESSFKSFEKTLHYDPNAF